MYFRVFSLKTGRETSRINVPTTYVSNTTLNFTIHDNHIYYDYLEKQSSQHHLIKYNITKQTKVWEKVYRNPSFSGITIDLFDSHIVCRSPNELCVFDKSTGEHLYTKKGKVGQVGGSFLIKDDRLIYSLDNGINYCVSLTNPDHIIWSHRSGKKAGFEPALIQDEKIYFSGYAAKVSCIEEETGNEIWRYSNDALGVSCGTSFGEQVLKVQNRLFFTHNTGSLFILNAANGKELQNIRLPSRQPSQGKLYQEKYYIISCEEVFVIFDIEQNKVVKTVSYPFSTSSDANIAGDYLVIETPKSRPLALANRMREMTFKQGRSTSPQLKYGVLVYDLKAIIDLIE